LRARQYVLALTYDNWLAAFVEMAVGLVAEKPLPVLRGASATRLTRVECLLRYQTVKASLLKKS